MLIRRRSPASAGIDIIETMLATLRMKDETEDAERLAVLSTNTSAAVWVTMASAVSSGERLTKARRL
ncbi:hypothetical protein B7W85_17830 [Allorhizobium ampelinum]|nr:hypothetical protein BBL07_08545 [Agrobacterium vitis]OVE92989.1 hypothetical protein B7W85_17830 [Allorhizobium ampelinum]